MYVCGVSSTHRFLWGEMNDYRINDEFGLVEKWPVRGVHVDGDGRARGLDAVRQGQADRRRARRHTDRSGAAAEPSRRQEEHGQEAGAARVDRVDSLQRQHGDQVFPQHCRESLRFSITRIRIFERK